MAAPALAGIPVTHRGLSSAFTVVSGHAEAAYRPILSALPPNQLTLVVLMGLASRADLASLLLSKGWAASTPAAISFAASTPDAATWVGRLDELGEVPFDADAPGTIVIGAVVSLAHRLDTRKAQAEAETDVEKRYASR